MAPSSPPPPRPLPQPAETTKRVQRRFVPNPRETSSGNSRTLQGQERPADDGITTRHRVLPQPVESSVKTSLKTPSADRHSKATFGSRPLPQPIESSQLSSKDRGFSPQLLETTSRRRRRGDTVPTVLDTDKTEYTPGDPIFLPRHLRVATRPGAVPIPPENSPVVSTEHVPQLQESRFSYANLRKRVHRDKPERNHSFRVPDLPSIPSQAAEGEDSSDSNCPSLSTTPSAESDETEVGKHAKSNRKGQDGEASGYILSLAARAAEKQLREQAMAAYPNENFHEPVDHFAIDRETEDPDKEEGVGRLSRSATHPIVRATSTSRRESDTAWDVADMRKHKEKAQQERHRREAEESRERGRKSSGREPAKEHHHHQEHREHHGHKRHPSKRGSGKGDPKNMMGEAQDDGQMKPMHKAASPPMAGANLKFPKCQTPKQTRLDVSQHPGAQLKVTSRSREHSGLWTPGGGASRANSQNGLWMGVCAVTAQRDLQPSVMQTGLLTPAVEKDDPFASASKTSAQQQLPPSPPTSVGSNKPSCLDKVLSREQIIDSEFHDGFITQVYNYLSLGFPSLARKYDAELSKITRVPIEALRQSDGHTNTKGYIGAPEGTGSDQRGMQEGECERWTALKLYVKEWARQQPKMGHRDQAGNEDWGARARKGSWAI
ncbi:MAG: hypothetical protein LQ351_004379 [Letrouitia transgressa]|nr:MAG: hypothetical protein LQ351_004379 [Letrouitia transgressa]